MRVCIQVHIFPLSLAIWTTLLICGSLPLDCRTIWQPLDDFFDRLFEQLVLILE